MRRIYRIQLLEPCSVCRLAAETMRRSRGLYLFTDSPASLCAGDQFSLIISLLFGFSLFLSGTDETGA